MPEPSVADDDARDLCTRLHDLEADLTPTQRALLRNILKIAYDATVPQESLDREFDDCFEPGQAELILAYEGAAKADMITRSWGPGTGPHMITRMITR